MVRMMKIPISVGRAILTYTIMTRACNHSSTLHASDGHGVTATPLLRVPLHGTGVQSITLTLMAAYGEIGLMPTDPMMLEGPRRCATRG